MNENKLSGTATVNGIKVTITVPDSINTVVRQQKINRIYDLLKPKNKTA